MNHFDDARELLSKSKVNHSGFVFYNPNDTEAVVAELLEKVTKLSEERRWLMISVGNRKKNGAKTKEIQRLKNKLSRIMKVARG